MAGVAAVVHLAGIATEAPFRDLLAVNIAAEAYAAEVLATAPPADPDSPEERYVGGEFAGRGYDAP